MRFIPAALSIWASCWTNSIGAPPIAQGDLLYTEAPRFDPQATLSGGERFPAGARLMVFARGTARPLVPDFAASADASLSFDTTRVLFSGKKTPADSWRIWEIALFRGTPKLASTGEGDCLRPLYLPLQKMVYTRRTQQGLQMEVAPLAGGAPMRLTFAPGNFIPSAILRDGRILFETSDLFTMYSDGSGVESYRCDHRSGRSAAAQVSTGDILFQVASGLGRFTSSRAGQMEVRLPQGEYFGPVADAGARWLVTCRTAPGSLPGICSVAPEGGQPPTMVVRGSDRAGAWQPVPIVPRAVPPYHPSGLGDASGANLLCLDSYASKAGRLAAGTVGTVRVWSQTGRGEDTVLGETAVDPDGSFYVQVPSERPLRIELLDRMGRSLRAEKGWFWMRKGEQRVCVGCHTGPERAPENAVPGVLERSQIPVPLRIDAGAIGGR